MSAAVLLLGPEAVALAERLAASGYQPLTALDHDSIVEAALLSSDQAVQIQELRRRWGPIPVLLDIATDSVEGRSRCLTAGADDYWLSSSPPSDLLTRLRLHLQLAARSTAPLPVLQVADLRVNPSGRQVKRGNRSVALTAREYQLLLLLLRHAGEVVSREQILREVWDDQQATASNVIEVYVRYLRQKLEEGGERRLIHTVRGRGYCLAERLPPLEGRG
ncbi:response regulator transcription factor [Synechococcus sp. CS-1328]|uniref:winged helix-turn-helix domain-containing protein n=1 Tax=Synechococcus sp. CS-1328 TaxID=2847976 RepID=UPI00223A9531|nr:response regulator transcription factor [Synechococcus sp. CS-1328]MCT0223829.1 response regulator transcription factor [Synechococcus sp. CS-1328]